MLNPGAEKMRLFFALWPSDEIRSRITNDTEGAVLEAGGKRVPAQNFHVTLAFLGQVRHSSLDDIIKTIHSVRFGPFELELDRTGYWPGSRTAWLGPSIKHMALLALVENIWDKLENMGFMREFAIYQPHVSLVRNADAELGLTPRAPIIWPVHAFALVNSVSNSAGTTYTVLEQFAAGD
jgi:2'-5' RNA ligase